MKKSSCLFVIVFLLWGRVIVFSMGACMLFGGPGPQAPVATPLMHTAYTNIVLVMEAETLWLTNCYEDVTFQDILSNSAQGCNFQA